MIIILKACFLFILIVTNKSIPPTDIKIYLQFTETIYLATQAQNKNTLKALS